MHDYEYNFHSDGDEGKADADENAISRPKTHVPEEIRREENDDEKEFNLIMLHLRSCNHV